MPGKVAFWDKVAAEMNLKAEKLKDVNGPAAEEFRKAALATGDFGAGSLRTEAATAFISSVVDESVLLKNVRLHLTDSPSGNIAKLSVTGPVTRQATENTAVTETRKPTNSNVPYVTAKTTSAIDISGEVTEDNIEGPSGQTTIMNAMTAQIANDMEILAIEGDDSNSGSEDIDELLKTNDGYHVKTASGTGAHIVDAGGLRTSFKLLSTMLRAMPSKWKKDLTKLRWIISTNAAQDLVDEWQTRATPGGDVMIRDGVLAAVHGIQPLIIPLIPEDLEIDGTAGSTGSFIWLTDPKNFIYVVQRALTIEWMRQPRADTNEGTVHMRTDFIIEEIDKVVKAVNLNVDTDVAYYGAAA